MPNWRACWAGLLWDRDVCAGTVTSVANIVSKQLRPSWLHTLTHTHTHKAHQITMKWGVKNSHILTVQRNLLTVCLSQAKPPNISFWHNRNLSLCHFAGAAGWRRLLTRRNIQQAIRPGAALALANSLRFHFSWRDFCRIASTSGAHLPINRHTEHLLFIACLFSSAQGPRADVYLTNRRKTDHQSALTFRCYCTVWLYQST